MQHSSDSTLSWLTPRIIVHSLLHEQKMKYTRCCVICFSLFVVFCICFVILFQHIKCFNFIFSLLTYFRLLFSCYFYSHRSFPLQFTYICMSVAIERVWVYYLIMFCLCNIIRFNVKRIYINLIYVRVFIEDCFKYLWFQGIPFKMDSDFLNLLIRIINYINTSYATSHLY